MQCLITVNRGLFSASVFTAVTFTCNRISVSIYKLYIIYLTVRLQYSNYYRRNVYSLQMQIGAVFV